MNPEYADWIQAWLVEHEPYGDCNRATKAMQKAFPELRRTPGYYYCMAWGRRTHWWLTSPEGEIVDPTAAQFPSKGAGIYEEVSDFSKFPTGVCMDCGEYVYNGDTFCDADCEAATRSYLGI